MADYHQPVHLSVRSCHYSLPNDLSFVTLVREAKTKTVKIRFSREIDIIVDIPLSAKTLSALAQTMGHLFGNEGDDLAEAIEDYRQKGGPVVDE